MKKITIILLCLLQGISSYAAILKGHVFDASTDQHIPFVNVVIENTKYYAVTDSTGHFKINNIPAGIYEVSVKSLGYKPLKVSTTIKEPLTVISLSLSPTTESLGEVSILGSQKKTNRDIAPVVTNRLTLKDLGNTNSTTLAQGLNYMPGIRVETNCQNCGTQQVRINGLDGQYTQILVDGMPMFSTLTKTYGLEQFPLNMIQNIELIRGGGSVLYGASAIGGVVNLITKDPDENSYSVDYNLSQIGGTSPDNMLNFNLSFVHPDLKSGISFFGNMHSRTPWDANGDGFSEIGQIRSNSLGMRAFMKPSNQDKITLDYRYTGDDRRGGDHFDLPPNEVMIAEATNYRIHSGGVGYIHTDKEHKKKLTINLTAQQTKRDSYFGANDSIQKTAIQLPDGAGNANEMSLNGQIKYEVNFDRLLFMPSKLTVGYLQEHSYLKDLQGDGSVAMNQLINLSSAFVQNEWQNEDLSLVVGLKGDKHNMVKGVSILPRANLRYRITKDMNLRAGYALGYRAPQLVGADFDAAIIGGQVTVTKLAPDLKPERSQSFTGGLDYRVYNNRSYAYFKLSGFYTQLNNVFVDVNQADDANGNAVIMRENGDGAKIYGLSLETTIQPISYLELEGGYTIQRSLYSQPENWTTDPDQATKTMLRSPNNYGYFTATVTPTNAFSASLSGTYTGSMLTPHLRGYIDQDELKKTPNFFDMGFKLSYGVNWSGNRVEFSTGIKNLFNQIQSDYDKGKDRDSQYIYGPSLPRTYFFGVKISSL